MPHEVVPLPFKPFRLTGLSKRLPTVPQILNLSHKESRHEVGHP